MDCHGVLGLPLYYLPSNTYLINNSAYITAMKVLFLFLNNITVKNNR